VTLTYNLDLEMASQVIYALWNLFDKFELGMVYIFKYHIHTNSTVLTVALNVWPKTSFILHH